MSLKNGEACPGCGSATIGLFPLVGIDCNGDDGKLTQLPLQLYTCGDCGLAELYVERPVMAWSKTPAEHGMQFSWVRPPPQGPYR